VPAVGEAAREFDRLGSHAGDLDRRRRLRRVTAEPKAREIEVVAVVIDGLPEST